MRTFLLISLCLVIALTLVSCGTVDEPESNEPETNEEEHDEYEGMDMSSTGSGGGDPLVSSWPMSGSFTP